MHQVNQAPYQHPLLQQVKNKNALDGFPIFLSCSGMILKFSDNITY